MTVVFLVVHSGPRRSVNRRSRAGDGSDSAIKGVGNARVDPAQGRGCPYRDAKLGEQAAARRRQLDAPGRPLQQVGAGKRA